MRMPVSYTHLDVYKRQQLYSLREDYGGEISNAIVGRVIWTWSDVRGK